MTSSTAAQRPAQPPRGQGDRSRRGQQRQGQAPAKLFTDADIDEANTKLPEAFALLGLFSDGQAVCPECGNFKKGTVRFRESKTSGKPYWKCFPCGKHGAATKLLMDKGGMTFKDAVLRLLGREVPGSTEVQKIEVPQIDIEPSFEAVVDVEVYNTVRASGSLAAAQEYWGQWFIEPEVVAEYNATLLTVDDPEVFKALVHAKSDTPEFKRAWARHRSHVKSLHKEWERRFGMDRLKACGLVSEKGYFFANEDYCVIEPHETPNGHVVGMQFRPVGEVKERVTAHKAWKKVWEKRITEFFPDGLVHLEDDASREAKENDAWQAAYAIDPAAAGEKVPHKTPFMSLKGAGTDSLVGCGISVLSKLPEGTTIYAVEGFKDVLSARTLGTYAYGMPGVGNMPPRKVCDTVLSRFDVVVALDGDKAGAAGRAAVLDYFATQVTIKAAAHLKDQALVERALNVFADNETLQSTAPGFTLETSGSYLVLQAVGPFPEGKSVRDVVATYGRLLGITPADMRVKTFGVRARPKETIRENMDVTDILVEKRTQELAASS